MSGGWEEKLISNINLDRDLACAYNRGLWDIRREGNSISLRNIYHNFITNSSDHETPFPRR